MSKIDAVILACVFGFALVAVVAGIIKCNSIRWSEKHVDRH